MKWTLQQLIKQKDGLVDFDETIVFPDEMFASLSHINGLKDIHVVGTAQLQNSNTQLYVKYQIDGVMILPCAVSNENVDYPFHIDSSRMFVFYKPEFEDDAIEAKRDTVDLTQEIFQDIMLEIPSRVVKDGATMKMKGNGWQVLSEEDLVKDEDDIDPRLAKLKDLFKE